MPRRARRAAVVASICLFAPACSSGDDGSEPVRASTAATDAPSAGSAGSDGSDGSTDGPAGDDDATGGSGSDDDGGAGADASTAVGATDPSVTTPSTEPPISVVEVAEIGVPGLDSDDAFCASWSRFAGSFQVVAVTAAFGSGPPEQLASLEVAAAPTVTDAYQQLITNWPDELSSEAELVAEDFLGPFARRLAAAREALDAAGADEATIAVISDGWVAGLAGRDPTTPEFVVDLPDEAWVVIDEAAALFGAQRVPFRDDPSLVTNVETPLTSEYLATSCPDQGTLAGQEVESP